MNRLNRHKLLAEITILHYYHSDNILISAYSVWDYSVTARIIVLLEIIIFITSGVFTEIIRLMFLFGEISTNSAPLQENSSVKPRLHQLNVEATLLNATSRTILSTKSNVASTLLLFWQQCCRFRQQCRTKFHPFDKVETNWAFSICFDFVERTKFRSTLLPKTATMSKQHSTLSKESFNL